MSADEERAEAVESLADFIATERDRHPRRADDMDSWELAAAITEWQASRTVAAAPSDTDEVEAMAIAVDVLRGYGHDAIADAIAGFTPQPVQVELTEANRALIAEVMQEDTGGRSVSWWRRRARRLAAALGGDLHNNVHSHAAWEAVEAIRAQLPNGEKRWPSTRRRR